jgi:hypothetical protein
MDRWRSGEAFMVEPTGPRRFRLSIKTLMIAVALCALFLAPLIWMYRQLELRVAMERIAADNARAQAERAADLVRFTQAGLSTTKSSNAVQPKTGTIWAALTVNRSTFKQGQTKDLRIEFSLVNDGAKVTDPKIAKSQIVINGKELADSKSIFGGVPKDVRIKPLAPGEGLQFNVLLGDQFKEPGTYQVSWKGGDFQSAEMVVRILPEKAR